MPAATPSKTRPIDWFDGLRVVEVTIGVSTPLTSRVLCDLGADVIKVESAAKPDVNRTRLPRPDAPPDVPSSETFGLLHEANAGKRSVTLNLKSNGGRETFLRLLDTADVFVQNFVPGWLERLGLSIEHLMDRNPELIVLSASCNGQTGPRNAQRAYAPVMTSLAGVEGVIGYEDGEVQGTMASALADLNASYVGVFALLSALLARTKGKGGRHLDLSQTEAAALLVGEAMAEEQLIGRSVGPVGNTGMTPHAWTLVRCANDVWVGVTGAEAPPPQALHDLAADLSSTALVSYCREHKLDAAVVQNSPNSLSGTTDPREHAQWAPHPLLGQVPVTTLPWWIDGARPTLASAAPILGQHTAVVLSELGLVDDEITQLANEGSLS